jgi:methylthioribose-1-phosphate isomerase
MQSNFRTLEYRGWSGTLVLLDQTKLPIEERYVELKTVEEVAHAIETLVVRGAPAIGLAAAYAMAIAARTGMKLADAEARLLRTRPTAVNLPFALGRMRRQWEGATGKVDAALLEAEAQALYNEEAAASKKMGEIGGALIHDGARILTHCNAGALATAELGTALAAIRSAHQAGKKIQVYADETRPVLQGARLTAWELMKDGIEVTLIPDGAVAHLLGEGKLDCAIVGADRIAKNGDAANKIGTRGVACLFDRHAKPFYVVAPWSTVDLSIPDGKAIVIEERDPREVTQIQGVAIAPSGVKVLNPAFDVTPAAWISGIVTDRGFTGKDVAAGLETQSVLDQLQPISDGFEDTAPTAFPSLKKQ